MRLGAEAWASKTLFSPSCSQASVQWGLGRVTFSFGNSSFWVSSHLCSLRLSHIQEGAVHSQPSFQALATP